MALSKLPGRSIVAALEAGVHEDDLLAGVNKEVLQTAAVNDLFVEGFLALLAPEGERLVHETAVEHANSFYFHIKNN